MIPKVEFLEGHWVVYFELPEARLELHSYMDGGKKRVRFTQTPTDPNADVIVYTYYDGFESYKNSIYRDEFNRLAGTWYELTRGADFVGSGGNLDEHISRF